MESVGLRLQIVLFGLCLGLVGLLPSSGQAQTAADAFRVADRFPAVGVRLSGMAGASIAGVGDAAAFFSNPSGLGYINDTQLSGALSTMVAKDRATYNLGSFQTINNGRGSHTAPSSINYLYKAPTRQGSLVLGGGYNQTNSFVRALNYSGRNDRNSITDYFMPVEGEFDIEQSPGPDEQLNTQDDIYDVSFFRDLSLIAFETYAIDFDRQLYQGGDPRPFWPAVMEGPIVQRDEVVEEGRTAEMSFGGAVEAAKNVMAGLALNVPIGSYRYDRFFEEIDRQNANDGSGLTTDFDALEYIQTIETDLVGVNMRGGVSTKVLSGLRLGVSLETPTYFVASENYSTKLRTFFDNGDSFEYGGKDGDPGTGEFDYNITTPWRFGVGGSFELVGLRVAGDLMYVDWSQMRLSAGQDRDYFNDVNRQIRRSYGAAWPYRIGAEYQLGAVSLRGGYALQPDPQTAGVNTKESKIYYTGGLGYQVSSGFTMEVSWMRQKFEDQYTPYTEVPGAPVVNEAVTRNMVSLGVQLAW